ncbi:MAG: hypothetical protein ACJA1B_001476 [Polaribacter sp.]|jgi:hypothetical protein
MLKLFRNIRQNLLLENKTSKYFKYAIGEIVLVVIGILIALQINNWNENRKALKKEQEIIVSLQQEIHQNITELNKILQSNERYLMQSDSLSSYLAPVFNNLQAQKIAIAFEYNPSTFDIPELEQIIASNSNVLIKQKYLISDLRNLKSNFNSIKDSQDYLDELWSSQIVDFFISSGLLIGTTQELEITISSKEMLAAGYSTKQLKALLNTKYVLHKVWKNQLQATLKKAEEVLALLNKTTND